jgi:hypothetical protein
MISAAAVLAGVGSLSLYLAVTPGSASAATLGGTATITNATTNAPVAAGGSSTTFTVALTSTNSSPAACSGDTASSQFHVFSYLVPKGTAVSSDNFSSGDPSVGLGLVDPNGNYYGAADTAPVSGEVIAIPTNLTFAGLLQVGETASALDGGSSAIWEAGIACANPSGVVADYWNTQVTFTASGSDPNGFTWSAVPGTVPPPPTAVSAVAGNTAVTVSWTDPTSNGGTAISGYDVFVSTTNPPSTSGTASAVASGAAATTATVTGLSDATTYYVVVTAVNSSGPSALSTVVSTTLAGTATITNATTNAPVLSGGSTTSFTVALTSTSTAPASCSADTASGQYHVFSYLLPQGTSLTTDNFSTGDPSVGLGLVDANGNYYGAADTAPVSGELIGIPTNLTFAGLLQVGETASALDGGSSAVWEAGIACASPSGVVTNAWNTQVTFSASGNDPNGFTWSAVPGTVAAAPTGPAALSGNASATVTWTDPTSNGGSPITAYDVYASTTSPPSTSGTPNATVSGASASSASITGLTNGTPYFFVVTAVNSVGQSLASSVTSTIPAATVPGAPTSPSATPGDTSATVTWTDPTNNGGSPITGYDVYASTTSPPSTSGTPNATVNGATATSVSVPALTDGTPYFFVVTAVNNVGQSSPSSVATTTPVATATVPGAPTSPSATPGDTSATVTWTDPTNNGGSPITGYDVYASATSPPSTTGTPSATVNGATATSVSVPALTDGTPYFFVVTAVNNVGQSSPSTVATTTPAAPSIPDAPTSLTVARNKKLATVSWTDPASSGGSPITGYDVYASTTSPPSTTGTPSATVSGSGATSATVKKLKKGKYFFVVTAVNAVGSSVASAVATTPDSTKTTVSCSTKKTPVDSTVMCTATVTDITVPSTTPQGTVSWTTAGAGTFGDGPSCTLETGTCSVTFEPTSLGRHVLTAQLVTSADDLFSTGKFSLRVQSAH